MKKLTNLMKKYEIEGDNLEWNLEVANEIKPEVGRFMETVDYYIDAIGHIDESTDKSDALRAFVSALNYLYDVNELLIFMFVFKEALKYDNEFPDFYYLMGKMAYRRRLKNSSYRNLSKCLYLLEKYNNKHPLITNENEVRNILIRLELG